MFTGTYYHTIEAKGRLSLPKEFRTQLPEQIILTPGIDGGLFVFEKQEWQQQLDQLEHRVFTKKQHRDFERVIANKVVEVELDTVGRILIPDFLRTYAQLEKDVVVVGSFSKIEVWNRERYHQYIETLEKQEANITESINLYEK